MKETAEQIRSKDKEQIKDNIIEFQAKLYASLEDDSIVWSNDDKEDLHLELVKYFVMSEHESFDVIKKRAKELLLTEKGA